jgi:predicted HAD superfamily Cof-like phosphohydrolase
MESPNALQQVAAFHHTFQHPVLPQPAIPSAARCALRVALLAEELKEMEEAIAQHDLTGVADALCDLQYVLAGAVLEFGLGEKFKALFEEVHRSNMSKACKTEQEAIETVAFYEKERNTPCFYQAVDGLFMVYRTADRKTLKSIYYQEARLEEIVKA